MGWLGDLLFGKKNIEWYDKEIRALEEKLGEKRQLLEAQSKLIPPNVYRLLRQSKDRETTYREIEEGALTSKRDKAARLGVSSKERLSSKPTNTEAVWTVVKLLNEIEDLQTQINGIKKERDSKYGLVHQPA